LLHASHNFWKISIICSSIQIKTVWGYKESNCVSVYAMPATCSFECFVYAHFRQCVAKCLQYELMYKKLKIQLIQKPPTHRNPMNFEGTYTLHFSQISPFLEKFRSAFEVFLPVLFCSSSHIRSTLSKNHASDPDCK